jgi:hypothetical protein
MFVAGDESRIHGSDVEPSNIDKIISRGGELIGRQNSFVSENAIDKNKFLIENFDIFETVSVGSLSQCFKVRGKTSGANYLLKVTRKVKYGSKKKSVYSLFMKYKSIVSGVILTVG